MGDGPFARSSRIKLHTGLTYHVLSWGADDAPLVVFLHGFLDFAWSWEAMVATGLLSRYRLVAPDLRGHGDSDRIGPGGYYHFMDYVADIEALVEILRDKGPGAPAEKVSIVAHSMGGTVAGYYAGAYPERVERLIMLEGLGPPDQSIDAMPDRIRAWLGAWRRVSNQAGRPPSSAMASLDEAAARLMRHDRRLAQPLALRLAEHGTVETGEGRRIFKHDPLHLTPGPYPFTLDGARAFWRRIACPVMLVDGQESEFQYDPADLARRCEAFQNARRVTLPDCGHMMQRHQPEALARLIADFLP